MELQEIIDKLKPYLEIEEYRQGHINEILDICMSILDNEIGDYSFRKLWINSTEALTSISPHILTQDEWRAHIRGLIAVLESNR